MIHTEPQRLEIERFIACEIDKQRADSLELHFKECSICHEYYLTICKQRDSFLRAHPFRSIAAAPVRLTVEPWWKSLVNSISRPALVPVYATFLLCAVFLPFALHEGLFTKENTVQYKGAIQQTSFIYQRDGSSIPGTDEYTIKKGDRVQIYYSSDKKQYVSLLSIDASGVISFYQPDQNSLNCSVETAEGSGIAFPGSIEFDEVKSDELAITVFSEQPILTSDITKWVSENFSVNRNLQKLANIIEREPFAKNTTIQTILLKKG